MKRFARILLDAIAALLLVLCVAAAVFWVRSYHVSEQVYRSRWWLDGATHRESAWWLQSRRGVAGVAHRWQDVTIDPRSRAVFQALAEKFEFSWHTDTPAELIDRTAGGRLRRLGFSRLNQPAATPFSPGAFLQWTAPYWSVCAALLIVPAWRISRFVLRRRARRRNRAGLCPVCSYDLRATPGRCPECGTENHRPAGSDDII